MNQPQRWIAYATLLALGALLAGLTLRRFYRLCYSLLPYLALPLVADVLVLGWPSRFWTWGFWMLKTTMVAVLRVAVALELGALIFQAFPGARSTAKRALALGLLSLLVGAVLPTVHHRPAGPGGEGVVEALPAMAMTLQPRLSTGAAFLFLTLFALTLYYNIPLHPWHRSVLVGLVAYLAVFALAYDFMKREGWEIAAAAGLVDNAAYLVLIAYWNWALWRPEEPPPADPETVSRLHPWRARLRRS